MYNLYICIVSLWICKYYQHMGIYMYTVFELILQVPATREVLASLPNVFSALCLNARGLESFVSCKPFDRLFKVLLSPDYLPAMRRRRGSDPFGKNGMMLLYLLLYSEFRILIGVKFGLALTQNHSRISGSKEFYKKAHLKLAHRSVN